VAATTATWIAERPVAATSRAFEAVRGASATAPVDVDDSAYVLGRFAGGAIGTFELSRCAPGRKNHLALEIHGRRGSVVYDYERANEVQLCLDDDGETAGFRRVLMGPAQDDGALLPFPGLGVGFAEGLVFQVRALHLAVAGGPPMAPDFYDGWRALAVAEAVLAAADRGWVTVPPPPAREA
jgi:predicted dehydrogenase